MSLLFAWGASPVPQAEPLPGDRRTGRSKHAAQRQIMCDIAGRIADPRVPLNRSRCAEFSAEGFVSRLDRLHQRLGVAAGIDLAYGLAEMAACYRDEGWLKPSAR